MLNALFSSKCSKCILLPNSVNNSQNNCGFRVDQNNFNDISFPNRIVAYVAFADTLCVLCRGILLEN